MKESIKKIASYVLEDVEKSEMKTMGYLITELELKLWY